MKDQNAVSEELKRIYERDGGLKASTVVTEAKPRTSPLHSHFEWNDKKGADAHRLDQARRLIRRVRVTIDDMPERMIHVPSVVTAACAVIEGVYKPASVIVESVDEYTRALSAALSKVNAAQAAVDDLREAASGRPDGDLARLECAVQALRAAQEALRH